MSEKQAVRAVPLLSRNACSNFCVCKILQIRDQGWIETCESVHSNERERGCYNSSFLPCWIFTRFIDTIELLLLLLKSNCMMIAWIRIELRCFSIVRCCVWIESFSGNKMSRCTQFSILFYEDLNRFIFELCIIFKIPQVNIMPCTQLRQVLNS